MVQGGSDLLGWKHCRRYEQGDLEEQQSDCGNDRVKWAGHSRIRGLVVVITATMGSARGVASLTVTAS